jgi:putative ABC transport system permease protein
MSLKEDLRHALRLEIKQPRFAILVILTLALGIGANTAIFSVVNAVILRQLPYRDPGQLVILQERDPSVGPMSVAYPNFLDWRKMSRSLEGLACYRSHNSVIVGKTGAERVSAKWVSAGYFSVLGDSLQLGRDFTTEEDSVGATQESVTG